MSHSALEYRRSESDAAQTDIFDVVIIGAGVTGACLFHQLRKKGFRVLLADRSDFAGGTSQASAMMLWGGLAYLRSFDLATVARLSYSREALVRGLADCVKPRKFRYLVSPPRVANRAIVQSALYLYWLLGAFRRSRPKLVADFQESPLLNAMNRECYEYEEGYLPDSDARFVLQWILRARSVDNPALNYCAVLDGRYDSGTRHWTLDVHDRILNRQHSIRARAVVNAAGVWTDSINTQFGIETPYRHILSKGVFLGLRRDPTHDTTLIVEQKNLDCFAFIPWGPVSLWGPTETFTSNLADAYTVNPADLRILLEEWDRHFARPIQPEDVVSLRCGVRGLAVPRGITPSLHSQSLSRKYVVHGDRDVSWVTIHGGKLTSCVSIAETAARAVAQYVQPSSTPKIAPATPAVETGLFPGLQQPVPSARWCANESCWSLQDYLRRRTNISQWIPRGGLGSRNENVAHLEQLSAVFATDDARSPRSAVAAYQREIEAGFDQVLNEALSTVPVEAL